LSGFGLHVVELPHGYGSSKHHHFGAIKTLKNKNKKLKARQNLIKKIKILKKLKQKKKEKKKIKGGSSHPLV
jgi:hypothetical protein